MTRLIIILSIILSMGAGYYFGLVSNQLNRDNLSEDIIANEIVLLEQFKAELPCELLLNYDQLVPQSHSKGLIIWKRQSGSKTISKLVVNSDLQIAQEDIENTCT